MCILHGLYMIGFFLFCFFVFFGVPLSAIRIIMLRFLLGDRHNSGSAPPTSDLVVWVGDTRTSIKYFSSEFGDPTPAERTPGPGVPVANHLTIAQDRPGFESHSLHFSQNLSLIKQNMYKSNFHRDQTVIFIKIF